MLKYILLAQVLFAIQIHGLQVFDLQSDYEKPQETFPLLFNGKLYFYETQTLDHFSNNNVGVWRHPYILNDTFYKPGGPAFLVVGDRFVGISNGFTNVLLDYAEKFSAVCVFVEHRYYGGSFPTPDISTFNLQYLSNAQALRDIPRIMENIKARFSILRNAKWIAFGSSYGGSLAAWLRLKYPHLIHGAVSSSAILQPTLGFPGYLQTVKQAYNSFNGSCSKEIQRAFGQLNTLLRSKEGVKKVSELLNFCQTGDNYRAVDRLYLNYAVVQRFKAAYDSDKMSSVCNIMTDSKTGTSLQRLGLLMRGNFCLIPYKVFEQVLQDQSHHGSRGMRQFVYQDCTESRLFAVSNGSSDFGGGFPLASYMELCHRTFPGYRFNYIHNIGLEYGGTNINVTNVVFYQGTKDVYHSLGLVKNADQLILVKGGLRDEVLNSRGPQDKPEIVEARKKIGAFIESWLKE